MSLEKRSPSFKLLRGAVGFAFGPITIQFMDDLGRPQGRHPEIFIRVDILIRIVLGRGVNKGFLGRHLGFLIRDLRTGLSLTSWMMFFLPKR